MRTDNRPNLLMVTHRVPHPPNRGDRVRTWNLLRTLAPHHRIHLACLVDEPVSLDSWRALSALTANIALEPVRGPIRWLRGFKSALRGQSITEGMFHSPALHAAIRNWTEHQNFHAALAVCSSTARYVEDLPIPLKVMDLVDVDSRKWEECTLGAGPIKRSIYRGEARRVAACERRISRAFDVVSVVTASEARLYNRVTHGKRALVVPNGVDLDYFQPAPPAQQPIAVFTGALDYHPNIHGIQWFCRFVWPQVRSAVPNAQLHLIGRRPAGAVRRLAELPGVKLFADVPDVRPYFTNAAVAVVPLHIARGVQNKVLEAMACARPVIATPEAAEGIGAQPERHLYVANLAEQWTERLKRLLRHPREGWGVASSARRFVQTYHRWDRTLEPLVRLLQTSRPPAIHTPEPQPLKRAA